MTDPDTVLIATGKTNSDYYHTRDDCTNLPKNPGKITLKDARERGLMECSVCQVGTKGGGRHGEELAQQLENMNPSDL